jgi:hypothetical protein
MWHISSSRAHEAGVTAGKAVRHIMLRGCLCWHAPGGLWPFFARAATPHVAYRFSLQTLQAIICSESSSSLTGTHCARCRHTFLWLLSCCGARAAICSRCGGCIRLVRSILSAGRAAGDHCGRDIHLCKDHEEHSDATAQERQARTAAPSPNAWQTGRKLVPRRVRHIGVGLMAILHSSLHC